MQEQQQELVKVYKQEFQAQGGKTPQSDDQIAQTLKSQNITDPEKAREAARKAAQQQQEQGGGPQVGGGSTPPKSQGR